MSSHGSSGKDQYGYPRSSHNDGVSALEAKGVSEAQADCVQSYFEQ
jgi:hypothetical protein